MHKTPEEAIEAAQQAAEESFDHITFEGMNCNDFSDQKDHCCGWDGFSRRCSCGNRRVYWATYGDSEKGFTAQAEAW